MRKENDYKEVKIRKIDQSVLMQLDELASKKGMSRESYLRSHIYSLVISQEIRAVEDKYENLVRLIADQAAYQNEVIERNNMLYEKLIEIIGGGER